MGITGVIPCAGTAERISGLPKFLLPTEDSFLIQRHIRDMEADRVWIGASKQNAAFLKPYIDGDVTIKGTLTTSTMTETILAARAYCGDDYVIMGMPDTYWTARHVYARLANRLTEFNWPVVAACWRIRDDQRGRLGQVDVRNDVIKGISDKDPLCHYPLAWGVVAWQPAFWEYLQPEMKSVGDAMQAAINAGVPVRAIEIEGEYFDCGTREEYFRLASTWVREPMYG